MIFPEMPIYDAYTSEDYDDLGRDFIEELLVHSIKYKRAVGFFSSSSLMHISKGIEYVASQHIPGEEPNIQFVVSCELDKEDVEAIEKGLKTREEIIEKRMLQSFQEPVTYFEKERLNMLCHHISTGAMEIKVAISEKKNSSLGIFHEKIGIMYDSEGNKVSFFGSLNETEAAYTDNYESITVYKSWDYSSSQCNYWEKHFDQLWNGKTKKAKVYDFPTAVKEKLFRYKKQTYDKDLDRHEREQKEIDEVGKKTPHIDKELTPTFPFDYQAEAINKFISNRGKGIFDMATGTGKTFTGYGAMVTLLKRVKYRLATIIVAPYIHLVDQWVEDAENFHITNMIVGHSGNRNYKDRLENTILDYNDRVIPYIFFICTYATYKSPDIQRMLKTITGPVLFVADEAHNCGSEGMKECLIESFQYRLALSATIERYRDEEGTKRIFNYFGEKCIYYPLEKAMAEGKLTDYEYHPEEVFFNQDERDEYVRLSKILAKQMYVDKDGNAKMTKQAEQTAIKRARLVAGCESKVPALISDLKEYKDDHFILVYCGTSKSGKGTEEETRQIDNITSILGNQLKMNVRKYTSSENPESRREIKARFQNGDDLQAIVAIKCLDEGVNIPSIRTAFILASSTNPREYIQRRGRVLRTCKGKNKAVIYDYICLPEKYEKLPGYDEQELQTFKTLVNNEINRIKEFSEHALNPAEGLELIEKIKEEYGLYRFDHDELASIEWLEEEDNG